jgi:hypothetical protein
MYVHEQTNNSKAASSRLRKGGTRTYGFVESHISVDKSNLKSCCYIINVHCALHNIMFYLHRGGGKKRYFATGALQAVQQ